MLPRAEEAPAVILVLAQLPPPLKRPSPWGSAAGQSLNSAITYFLSLHRQPVPPPAPLGILLPTGSEIKPPGVSPA